MAKIFHPLLAYYNMTRSHMERGHLPPIREVAEEAPTLDRDQIIVRSHVGGLMKSFERKVACLDWPRRIAPHLLENRLGLQAVYRFCSEHCCDD